MVWLAFLSLREKFKKEKIFLVQLAEGYQVDESEESVVMTREEINNYMKQKMREYSEDPEINKLINVKEQVKEKLDVLKNIEQKLHNEQVELAEGYQADESEESVVMTREEINNYMKQKMREYSEDPEINKLINRVGYVDMLDDQMKLLQHAGELPKAETRNASAYVDFPILPEEFPPVELLKKDFDVLIDGPAFMGGEYFVDDIPSCKILRPSAKASTKSDSAFKKSTNTEELELIPKVECIDISNDTPIKSTNDACIQPTRDAPAQSTSKATSRRRAKSSRIAPAMLTYTEPTASTSANSGATGGAPEMKGPSAPLVLRPSAPLVLRPSAPLVLRPSAPLVLRPSAPLVLRPYTAHIITLPNLPPKPCLGICNGEGDFEAMIPTCRKGVDSFSPVAEWCWQLFGLPFGYVRFQDRCSLINRSSSKDGDGFTVVGRKGRRIAPIVIDSQRNATELLDQLGKFCDTPLEGRYENGKLRVFPVSAEEHRLIQKYISDNKLRSHTFEMAHNKQLKVVIRGLPTDFDQELLSELHAFGFKPNHISLLRNRKTNTNMPLFLVTLPKCPENQDIFNIKQLDFLELWLNPSINLLCLLSVIAVRSFFITLGFALEHRSV
ncbi:nucleic-acid-binding protein from transposon X-element [Trichonephila inaurata madagascariensis]|uniref:Nucleic-acid-binding protein from transposon X-element n=1 Tax=Trichonephila inaurata madagascariensis TaxID=2747483 RepID=A0A8X6MFJ5_9ARAC|nr:nucleic-acid-binding protein from transposon X-element [Trichonephila inaurata madagascariensis]